MKLQFLALIFSLAINGQVMANEKQSFLTSGMKLSVSAGDESLKLDSTVTYTFRNTADSVYKTKTLNSFLDNSLKTSVLVLNYDTVSGIWNNYQTDTTEYDSNDEVSRTITYYWDTSAAKWFLNRKIEYIREGDSITFIQSDYDTSMQVWIYYYMQVREFEPMVGSNILEETYFWNTGLNSWVGSSKTVYIYDDFTQHLKDTVYKWDNDRMDWKGEKTLKLYNVGGRDSSTIYYHWDESMQQWNIYSKIDWNYYYLGLNYFVESIFSFRDNDLAKYDTVYKRVWYVYGHSTETEYYQFVTHMPANITEWVQKERSEFTINSEGRIDTILTFNLNSEDAWDTSSISRCEYFEDGTFSYFETLNSYDTETHLFENGTRQINERDSEGKNTLYAYYYFDGLNQEWVGTNKTESVYEGEDLQRYESYMWDFMLKDWKGQYAFENHNNEDGNIGRIVGFKWESGNWEVSTKQYFYYSPFEEPVFHSNNAPSIDQVSDQEMGIETIDFEITGITDGDGNTQILTINASSNNEDVANVNITYTNGSTGILSITGVSEGSAVITILVKDDGGTSLGGTDSIKMTFIVTINVPDFINDNITEKFNIYPNPVLDIVYIQGMKALRVDVLSLNGNILETFYNTRSIDISQMSGGMYILKITSDDSSGKYVRIFKQ